MFSRFHLIIRNSPREAEVPDQIEAGRSVEIIEPVSICVLDDRAGLRVRFAMSHPDSMRSTGRLAALLMLEGAVTINDGATEPVASEPGNESARPRLLLVEDDWITHSALRKILIKLGWEVHSAMTVSDGLALLHLKPDAIILDMMLPDGDGVDVLRQVRAENQPAKVAVTTGIDDRARLEKVRELAPDAVLRKPLELEDLLRVLE
jgi:CheY-like chemotaxis protein